MQAPTNRLGTVLARSLPLGLAALLGCADLDAGTDSSSDGLDSTGPEPDRVVDWSCLDQEPLAALPPPEQLELTLEVPGSRVIDSSIASTISVTLCAVPDLECAEPLQLPCDFSSPGLRPAWGSRSSACRIVVPLPAAFSGFLELELEQPPETPAEQRYLPLLYSLRDYSQGDRASQPPTLAPLPLFIRRQTLGSMLERSRPAIEPLEAESRGAALLAVSDCKGSPVGQARLEIRSSAGASPVALPFQLPASRIPSVWPPEQPLHTGSSGLAGYLLMPPGPLQVLAFVAGRSEPVAAVALASLPGRLTMARLQPAQANGPGAP